MFLHGGNGVPHESERHMPVGTVLVLNERINVSLTLCGLQRVQHVGKIGPQVFLNKGARFQQQVVRSHSCSSICGQMQGQKIPGGIRMCQEGFKQPVLGNR